MSDAAKISVPLHGLFRNVMALIIAAYLVLTAYLWRETVADVRNELAYTDTMLVHAARSTLKSHELVLRVLGQELIMQGALDAPEKGRGLLDRVKELDPGIVGIRLAKPDGKLILSSRAGERESLATPDGQRVGRDEFAEALGSSHVRAGRPVFRVGARAWAVPILLAIRDNSGTVKAVITADFSLYSATTEWHNISLLPKVSVALMGDDGYVRYFHPLPVPTAEGTPNEGYATPVDSAVRRRIAHVKDEHAFMTLSLPRSGGVNYLFYTRIPEFGLHAGSFVTRSVVVAKWLGRLVVPTSLMLLFLAGGFIAYRRAVLQQARADFEIRRLSAWRQAVLDGTAYSIISTDPNGTIVSFNQTAQRMLGYRPDEVVGKVTPVIIHDPDEVERRAEELSTELRRAVKPGFEAFVAKARLGKADEREWTYIRKDGSRFPIRLSVTAMHDERGAIIGFMGVAVDLSEDKAVRATLMDSEARYKNLFEHAGDAIFLMRGNRFVDCNPAALRMFGCTRDQIIGATPMQYSPAVQPDGKPSRLKAQDKIASALKGDSQFFEWLHTRHDGTPFDAEVTLNMVELSGESHLLAMVRDISARKLGEAELTLSRQLLIERNESLDLINRLSQRLHGILSLDEILDQTVQALVGLSRAPQVAIYLVQDDNTQLRLMASHGFPPELQAAGKTLPMDGSLTGFAISRGTPFEMTDIATDERLFPSVRNALLGLGATSGLVIPLLFQGQALGSINLIYKQRHDFGQTEVDALVSMGNTVALAIANARHVEDLAFQARHDSLTGLANRLMLHEAFDEFVERSGGTGAHAALMLLDVDRFKEVNDTLGHHVGDQLLTLIGQRLGLLCAAPGQLVTRLGGDEFATFLHRLETPETALAMAERMIDALRQPFSVEGFEMSLSASVGVAFYPDHGRDSHALLRAADVAMYHAKATAAGMSLYDSEFDIYSTERLALAHELAQAIQQEQLVLHYQPKIEIKSGLTVGYEALVRWQHPRHGLLYPGVFIHLVEMGEVIHPFTRAVMELAVRDKRRLHELGHHQAMAINLSALNLTDARSYTALVDATTKYELPASEVELELTETAVMHDAEKALALLERFSALGVNITIDDFGTGYSSLAYLRRLPITALKIDQSFVKEMCSSKHDTTIVRSTVSLAHNLNLKVIAEGVEDSETLALLHGMGCDQAQGYGISKPVPLDQLVSWLSDRAVDGQ